MSIFEPTVLVLNPYQSIQRAEQWWFSGKIRGAAVLNFLSILGPSYKEVR